MLKKLFQMQRINLFLKTSLKINNLLNICVN